MNISETLSNTLLIFWSVSYENHQVSRETMETPTKATGYPSDGLRKRYVILHLTFYHETILIVFLQINPQNSRPRDSRFRSVVHAIDLASTEPPP